MRVTALSLSNCKNWLLRKKLRSSVTRYSSTVSPPPLPPLPSPLSPLSSTARECSSSSQFCAFLVQFPQSARGETTAAALDWAGQKQTSAACSSQKVVVHYTSLAGLRMLSPAVCTAFINVERNKSVSCERGMNVYWLARLLSILLNSYLYIFDSA